MGDKKSPTRYGHRHGHSPFTEGNEHRAKQQIKPRQYGVTLDQIQKKIDDFKKENRELEESIASWEEKIREAKKQAEMKREHKLSLAEVRKLKENIKKVEDINENMKDTLHFKQALLQAEREKNIKNVDVAQDELGDQELRALTSKNQELKESKKFLEDRGNALSSQKTAKEAELNLLKKKLAMVVEFSERRKLTAEEKLEETLSELNATKNELSAADENLKVTEEEMEKCRKQVEEMQDQLQEAELTFKGQIAVQERNALANWRKARDWETRMMQQSRENAYLKYRLRMMKGEMLPVGSMRREPMPGRPELQRPLWQAPRPVPRMNGSTSPQTDPEMATVGRGVRDFPHCPGPLHMPYHMGRNVPGFPPPHPPPQWWTWGP